MSQYKSIFGGNSSTFTNLTVLQNTSTDTLTATTVTATNGNFTNLTGTISPGQVVVKRNETTRDNATLIAGNISATGTNSSNGVHVGYNNTNETGSIYTVNNSGTTTALYLNMPATGGNGVVIGETFQTDNINELTTNAGVEFNSNMIIKTSEIKTAGGNLAINSETGDVLLQNAGSTGLTIAAAAVTSTRSLTASAGITMPANQILNINAGSARFGESGISLASGPLDACHISTASNSALSWIALSGGIEGTGVKRFVAGDLAGIATIGGHQFTTGVGYLGWADLNINTGGGNVRIGPYAPTLQNQLMCGSYVDAETGYKIATKSALDATSLYLQNGSATSTLTTTATNTNTYQLPNKSAGSYILATTQEAAQMFQCNSNGTLITSYYVGLNGMSPNIDGVQYVINRSGLLKNFYVNYTGAAPSAGQYYEAVIYVNGLSTALTVVVNSPNLTGNNTVTSVSVNAGDRITINFTYSLGVNPVAYGAFTYDLAFA